MERNNSSSLRRALALLDAVAGATPAGGATLTGLATTIDVHKSSAMRLLAPLVDEELVLAEHGRYVLGPATVRLGQVYLGSLDLRAAAHPLLRELMTATEQSVHLVMPDLPEMVYVDKIDGPGRVRMASTIGLRQPAHSTGVGKAYLAAAGDDEVARVVEHGLAARTENTITEPARFRAELADVRERGFAIDDVENEHDIRCVAAAIFDHTGRPAAAVSVAGLVTRITVDQIDELGACVAATGRAISATLGAP